MLRADGDGGGGGGGGVSGPQGIAAPANNATAWIGQTISFSAAGYDPIPTWYFGDGASASGAGAVGHAYNAAGAMSVTLYYPRQPDNIPAFYDYRTINVLPKPTISAFSATPVAINKGQSATLSWAATGSGVTYSLNQGIGTVSGTSRVVSPVSTTTYTLTASNGSGSVSAQCTVTVNPPPTITSLTVSPGTLFLGQSTTLNWSVTGTGVSLSLSPGIGAVTGNSRVVTPTVTTTYTLTASTGSGSVSAQCTVTVNPPPTIASLTASPSSIFLGQSTTLNWSVTGTGVSLSLSPGIGAVSGISRVVTPTATTTYTLTASNGAGSVSAQCTVYVDPPPTIAALTASPSSNFPGQAVTLSWSTAGNGYSLSLSPGIGNITGNSLVVYPAATTTYTLTASNPAGSVSSQCTVTVSPAPTLSATPGTIYQGQTTTLNWSVAGPVAYQVMSPGIGSVSGNSLLVYPTTTTTYFLAVGNGSGSAYSNQVTVTVNPPPIYAPVLDTVPNGTLPVGQAGSLVLPAATDPQGSILSYSLSGLPGGLSFKNDPAVRTISGTPTTTGTYHLTYTVSNALGLSVYAYPTLTVTSRSLVSMVVNTSIQYGYDDQGRLQTLTYPNLKQVMYSYDDLDRVIKVKRDGQDVVRQITYDGWSNRKQMQFQSGALDQWTYDPSGSLLKQWDVGTVGNLPQSRTYQYDNADRLIQAGEWTLGYDLNSRMTSAAGYGFTNSLTHDAFGNNISSVSAGVVPNAMNNYTFNTEGDNQLPALAPNGGLTDLLKSDYGEIVQVATGISTGIDLNASWDALGRLATVQGPNGVSAWRSVESFAYTASGLRVTRVDSAAPSLNRAYAYTGSGLLLSESTANGSLVWNRDVIYLGTVAVAEVDASGAVHELHSDPQGTPRVSTSAAGSIEGSQAYGPYGEPLSTYTTGYVPLTGYTGHLQTEPNGLIYMRGRFYSPAWHCFLNSNQGQDPKQLNQYAYVLGNPMMNTDPTGMDNCPNTDGRSSESREAGGVGRGGDMSGNSGGDPGHASLKDGIDAAQKAADEHARYEKSIGYISPDGRIRLTMHDLEEMGNPNLDKLSPDQIADIVDKCLALGAQLTGTIKDAMALLNGDVPTNSPRIMAAGLDAFSAGQTAGTLPGPTIK